MYSWGYNPYFNGTHSLQAYPIYRMLNRICRYSNNSYVVLKSTF